MERAKLEKDWRSHPSDQRRLARAIEARWRAGLAAPLDMLETIAIPKRRLATKLPFELRTFIGKGYWSGETSSRRPQVVPSTGLLMAQPKWDDLGGASRETLRRVLAEVRRLGIAGVDLTSSKLDDRALDLLARADLGRPDARFRHLMGLDLQLNRMKPELLARILANGEGLVFLELSDIGGIDATAARALSKLTRLVELGLGNSHLGGAVSRLARLTGLARLNLKGGSLTDRQLVHVGRLTGLVELNLSVNRIRGSGLRHLERLRGLRSLWITHNELAPSSVARFGSSPALEELSLSSNPLRGADLGELASCERLAELDLSNTGLRDRDLRGLPKVASIRRLRIRNNGLTGAALKHLAGLVAIEDLDLGNSDMRTGSLNALMRLMKPRRKLPPLNRIDGRSLERLADLPRLCHLGLAGNTVSREGLIALAKLPRLASLDLSGDHAYDEEHLAVLAESSSLEIVYLPRRLLATLDRRQLPGRVFRMIEGR
jgi:hypothetical protein